MKSPQWVQSIRFGLLTAFLGLVVAGFLVLAAHADEQLYTCGMHPQIIKTEPGDCPICGMKLTPVRDNTAAAVADDAPAAPSGERRLLYYKSTMIPGQVSDKPGKDSMGMDMAPVYEGDEAQSTAIHIDAATVQRMNLKTAPVERGPVRRQLRAVGTVAYDEQGLRDVTTKYEGWLERLYVDATWTAVKAGDPLFEIYSPDLYNAQLNYLVALRSEGEPGGPLTGAARARLQLLDLPGELIDELTWVGAALPSPASPLDTAGGIADRLTPRGEPPRTFLFRAPASGVVIDKMAVAGQMMKPGEPIYRLADLSSVWVLAQVYEADLPFVHQGQAAVVRATYGPERIYPAKVDLILPQVEEQTRAATARLVLANPDGSLRPGMFVDVHLTAQLADDAVLVPDVAVLRSGQRNTVFVALDGGAFEPRKVELGARSEGDRYEVLSGLEAGERVVTSGQFMLDSESQLREAIQKMLRGAAPEASPSPWWTQP